jgi:hypothetical protein
MKKLFFLLTLVFVNFTVFSENLSIEKSFSTKIVKSKKEKTGGRFVKIFNLTKYKMYGMNNELKDIVFYPGNVLNADSLDESYVVSEKQGIKYRVRGDFLFDEHNKRIKDSTFLSKNADSSGLAMRFVWLPFGNVNFNFRYQNDTLLDDRDVFLLAVVQRKITKSTSIIIITDNDSKKYLPEERAIRRKIQNETDKTFILRLNDKKIISSAKNWRRISLSENFFLPNGVYYLPMSIMYRKQMYEIYFLVILNSQNKYLVIKDCDILDLEIFNQKLLR